MVGTARKERELGSQLPCQLLLHTANDRGRTAAYTRYHGNTLPKADRKGLAIADLFLRVDGARSLLIEYLVHKQQENTAHQQRDGHCSRLSSNASILSEKK